MCSWLHLVKTSNKTSNATPANVLKYIDECTMHDTLFIYILPIIIFVGTINNLLSIFVFRRQKLRVLSVGYFLFVYAIGNLLILYVVYGMSWLSMVADIPDISTITDWGCRIWAFFYRMVAYCSIWFLVATLVDRYISVCHPKRAATMCQVFMAKIAILIIMTGLLVISVHAMWSYELQNPSNSSGPVCIIAEDLHSSIWKWTSASFYVFIPSVTLFIINVVLLFEMCVKNRSRRVQKQDGVPIDLTNTVLALSFTYLTLATPATVVNIMDASISESLYVNMDFMYHLGLIRTVSNLLSCGNPAVTFLVCMLFSRTFRREFVDGWLDIITKKSKPIIFTEMKQSSSRHIVIMEPDGNSYETLL